MVTRAIGTPAPEDAEGASVTYEPVDEISAEPTRTRVYEHGWQSWSPSTDYPVDATSYRPRRPVTQVMSYRPGKPGPATGFQGEGLLGVESWNGEPARLYA